jgi:hypothetical protein
MWSTFYLRERERERYTTPQNEKDEQGLRTVLLVMRDAKLRRHECGGIDGV